MAAFKVGDVVRLNSGGPKMTVNSIGASGRIECFWFGDQTQSPNHAVFNTETVTLVPEQDKSN